jgi:hypothetical protein
VFSACIGTNRTTKRYETVHSLATYGNGERTGDISNMLGSGGRDGHEERVIFRDLVSSRVVYEKHLIRAQSRLRAVPWKASD